MDVSSSPTIQYQVLVVAAGLTFLAGFLINVFIVAVTICEWKKGRPVSKTDKVITSLGITRMIFQGVCLLNIIICTYFPRLNIFFFIFLVFLEFASAYSSTWLSTLLSAVFCLQIFTLHNVFFLKLKTFVLKKVYHLIMAAMVVSFIYAFFNSFLPMIIDFPTMSNNSTQEKNISLAYGLWISSLIFLSFGPFLIYFISSVLLIFYLCHHIRRMKSQSNGTSRLDTYYKTIKFTGFSLFCSTVFIILAQASSFLFEGFGLLGYHFLWQIFPALHSMYLIYVTIKLRSQVSNMILLMKTKCCCPKAPEETETRL